MDSLSVDLCFDFIKKFDHFLIVTQQSLSIVEDH